MEQTCLYTLILPQSFPRRPHVSPHAPFISAETYFSSVSKGKNSSVQQKAPAGDDGYLCMSYCGKHFISTRK